MKRLGIFVFLFAISHLSHGADASEQARLNNAQQLLKQARAYQADEKALQRFREAQFKQNLDEQNRLLKQAKAELAAAKAKAKSLKEQFDNNEKRLVEQEEALRLAVGNLGEMFGVVRQVASDLRTTRSSGLTQLDATKAEADLDQLAEAKALPNITQLEGLWRTLLHSMLSNGQITQFSAPAVMLDGNTENIDVTRLGAFNVISSQGYLTFDDHLKQLQTMGRQPQQASYVDAYLSSQQPYARLAIDPSRGALLNVSLDAPNMLERIEQGAEVGYIILALGALGLLITLWRIITLLVIGGGIKQQLTRMQEPKDSNPLGRIALAYHSFRAPEGQDQSAQDALQAKLDEAVLKELPSIERGQSIIKLFAGIAPLLGLLGTVTGMIATFQAISTFGSGDPKLMATGISQALITTVLGLVVAIPLLLAHSLVASRSKRLVQVLDEQAAGFIAQAHENK